MKTLAVAIAGMMMFSALTGAAIKTETVTYENAGQKFVGYIAYDDAIQGKAPGVVVYPEWWGVTPYAKHRAQMLAELGYVAMAVDLYGDGKTTDDPKQAGQWAGALKSNRALLRQRANAGLDELKKRANVDADRLGAIGYCFGGTTAIELGRSGADVKAIVTFHAGLDSPTPADGKNIKGHLLVCHGGDDKFISEKDMDAFQQEMRENNVDWVIITFGGAVHSFSNPDADRHNMPGVAYNERADRRSWHAMKELFAHFLKGESVK